MGKTLKAIQRGIEAGIAAMQNPRAHHFQVADLPVVCSHCGNRTFEPLEIAGDSLSRHAIACCNCSHIEYFLQAPLRID